MKMVIAVLIPYYLILSWLNYKVVGQIGAKKLGWVKKYWLQFMVVSFVIVSNEIAVGDFILPGLMNSVLFGRPEPWEHLLGRSLVFILVQSPAFISSALGIIKMRANLKQSQKIIRINF